MADGGCLCGGGRISIMAGTLDLPTGLGTEAHIFVDDKSDYYSLHDGLPQHAASPPADFAKIAE